MLALDIGCGTNKTYKFRTYIPKNYYAIFIDIEFPDKNLIKFGEWVIASGEYLPFRSNVFDLVISSHVIEHLNNPIKHLLEIYRILKVNGKLILKTPNKFSKNCYLDKSHKYCFTFIGIPCVAILVEAKAVSESSINITVDIFYSFI